MRKYKRFMGRNKAGYAGIEKGTKKFRKAHREYVAKWRADSRDRYSGPGRRADELPERYRPKKRKGKGKK